jgi:hypothetical protein
MQSRRWIGLIFGTGLALASLPALASAQTTGGTTTGGTTTTGSSGSLLSGLGSNTGGTTTGGGTAGSTSAQTLSPTIGGGLTVNAATIAASSGTPSATTIPSNTNFLGSNYVNYFTLGLPANYQSKFGAQNVTGGAGMKGAFGKYIYVPNPSTSNAAAAAVSSQGSGFATFGQPRAPVYSTRLAESFPVVTPSLANIRTDVTDTIANSSMLKNRGTINVALSGAVVTLTGVVGSETERATAEGMIRMTPGVQGVQNNLLIDPSKK